jgi:hypothetical protein
VGSKTATDPSVVLLQQSKMKHIFQYPFAMHYGKITSIIWDPTNHSAFCR